jgi:hypothetical protein
MIEVKNTASPVEIGLTADFTHFTLTFTGPTGRKHSVKMKVQSTVRVPCKCKQFKSILGSNSTKADKEAEKQMHIQDAMYTGECENPDHVSYISNPTVDALFTVLQARDQQVARDEKLSLGTKGAPTQALVDAFLAAGNKVNDEAQRAEDRLRATVGESGMAVLAKINLNL